MNANMNVEIQTMTRYAFNQCSKVIILIKQSRWDGVTDVLQHGQRKTNQWITFAI